MQWHPVDHVSVCHLYIYINKYIYIYIYPFLFSFLEPSFHKRKACTTLQDPRGIFFVTRRSRFNLTLTFVYCTF